MKKYNQESIVIPQRTKDVFVSRSRQQSNDVFVATLAIAVPVGIALDFIAYQAFGKFIIVFTLIAFLYSVFEWARTRVAFTIEDRSILNSKYFQDDNVITETKNDDSIDTKDNTLLPMAKRKGNHVLHIGLTVSQIEHIAKCAINKGNLTINYLESLGLSRQQAELLRMELAQYNIVQFDKNEKAIVTDYGRKVFEKALK